MNPIDHIRPIAIVAAVLGLVSITWASLGYSSARNEHHAAVSSTGVIRTQLHEIESLRSQTARAASALPPKQDLFARVNAQLSSVGLPTSMFDRVSIGASTELRQRGGVATGYRSISAEASFHNAVPADIMRFAQRWRETETLWTITTIEFIAIPDRSRREPNYTVRLGLKAVYVAQGDAS